VTYTGINHSNKGMNISDGVGDGGGLQSMTSEVAQRELQHSMFLPVMFRRSGVAHSHAHQASVHWTSNTALVDLNMLVQFKPGSLLHDQRLYLDRIAHLEHLTSSTNPYSATATGDVDANSAEVTPVTLSAAVGPATTTTTSRSTTHSRASKWREPLGFMIGNAFSLTLASSLDTDFKHYQSAIFARFNSVCHAALLATAAVTTAMGKDRGQTYQPEVPSGQAAKGNTFDARASAASASAASSKDTAATGTGTGAGAGVAVSRAKSRELVVDVARDVERGLKDYLKGVLQVRVTLLDAGTGPDGATEVFYDTVTYDLEKEAVVSSSKSSVGGGGVLAGKRALKTLATLQASAADALARELMGGQRGDLGIDGTLLEGLVCVARLPVGSGSGSGSGSRVTTRGIRGSITLWGANEHAENPVYNPKADVCPFMQPWILYKETSFDVTHAPATVQLDASGSGGGGGGGAARGGYSGGGGGNIVASDVDDVYVIESNVFTANDGGGVGRAQQVLKPGSYAAAALLHVNGGERGGSGGSGSSSGEVRRSTSTEHASFANPEADAESDSGLNETIRLHLTTTQLALARLLRALASAFCQRCNDIVSTDVVRTRLGALVGKHSRSKGARSLYF
jgi:hypothetical protein